jgi:hypothetical protein
LLQLQSSLSLPVATAANALGLGLSHDSFPTYQHKSHGSCLSLRTFYHWWATFLNFYQENKLCTDNLHLIFRSSLCCNCRHSWCRHHLCCCTCWVGGGVVVKERYILHPYHQRYTQLMDISDIPGELICGIIETTFAAILPCVGIFTSTEAWNWSCPSPDGARVWLRWPMVHDQSEWIGAIWNAKEWKTNKWRFNTTNKREEGDEDLYQGTSPSFIFMLTT